MTRLIQLGTVALAGLGLAVLTWPEVAGLARAPIAAHVVALRGLAVVGALLLAVPFAVLAARARGARTLCLGLTVLLLGYAGVNGAIVADRGLLTVQVSHPGLTVLVWNTLGDAPGAQAIADLASRVEADVVALPETTAATGERVAGILGDMASFTVTNGDEPSHATTLLVSTALGEYRIDEDAPVTAVLPTLVAVPVEGEGPTLVAVHTLAPIPPMLHAWEQDLRIVAELCSGHDVILAGDFNATADHFAGLNAAPVTHLGDCADAAVAVGAGGLGTWPAWLPAELSSPIDHVLTTRGRPAEGVWFPEAAGSDHRPIVVQLGR